MRNLIATLLSFIVIAAWPGYVAAHASLERSQPAEDAVVTTSPTSVQLWFTRGLEASFSKVQVLDQSGKQIDKGNPVVKGDGKQLEVEVPTLTPGTYKVVWRIVALDGHKAKGEFRFTIK